MTQYTIYCHTHIESGRRYVGLTKQTMERRWSNHVHVSNSAKNGSWHFPNAIRKYGKDAFSHEILEVCLDLESANSAEIKWINTYETRNPAKGFNLAPGGSHTPHPTKNPWDRPEYKDKCIEASKNRWKRHEYRQKSMISAKAKWDDPDFRAKGVAASKARWDKPGFKEKISKAQKEVHSRPEWKMRMSEASKKAFTDQDVKDRHSASLRGRKLSEEHKAKISACRKAREAMILLNPDMKKKQSESAKEGYRKSLMRNNSIAFQ